MKRITIFIGLFFATASFLTSCQQDVEVWDSETLNYSGRYVIKLMSEDLSETYHDYDGSELDIYNTSANIANEVWIEDVSKVIPLKCKFSFTGTAASFKSANMEFDKLTNNLNAIVPPKASEKVPDPTAEGQTAEVARDYLRAVVVDGKIIPKGTKSKGGNVVDSLYMKVKFYSGKVIFNSKLKAQKDWKDPTKPEFAWILSSVTYDPTKGELMVINGRGYTGFEEDEYK